MPSPQELDETTFCAEARELGTLLSARGVRGRGPSGVAGASEPPQRVRLFWDEVGRSPAIDMRLWPWGSPPSPSVAEAIRGSEGIEGLTPSVVQRVVDDAFVGADGAHEPAAPIERARGRAFIALVDARDASEDPAVYRLDRGDPSLVRDEPSYIRFATDTLVRFALGTEVLLEVHLSRPEWGDSRLPSFAPGLRALGGEVFTLPVCETHPASRWVASPSLREAVAVFLAAPPDLLLISDPQPSGRVKSFAFVRPGRDVADGLQALRRFVGAAVSLPPRRVLPVETGARYVRTTWIGALDGAAVWCTRAAEARPGFIHMATDEADAEIVRAWARRHGFRESR
jgi:hypothetical protein